MIKEEQKGFFNRKSIIFMIISIVLLTLCLFQNLALRTTNRGVERFDFYSDGIMIADLLYHNTWENDSQFQKVINPDMKFLDGSTGVWDEIKENYLNNHSYAQEQYANYYSNLTFHRFFYNAIDYLVSDKELVLYILYFINAMLLAIVVSFLLLWLKKITNTLTVYGTLILLAFFAPNFIMYGVNLYWAAWSLFLPIIFSIFVIESEYFERSEKKYYLPLIIAFLTCLYKQLFYFEFVSTVMISMMIPYFYYAFYMKMSIKQAIKLWMYPISGAMLSFLAASIIKIIMLSVEFGSLHKALSMFFGPILVRIIGDSTSTNDLISHAANVSRTELVYNMLAMPAFSIKNVLDISQLGLIVIVSLMLLIIGCSYPSFVAFRKSKVYPLALSTLIAWTAPLSWFILAKPHAVVHQLICSITWFVPFAIFATSLIIYSISDLFIRIYRGENVWHNLMTYKKRSTILVILSVIVFISVGVYTITRTSNVENMNEITQNGALWSQSRQMKVYYYKDSLYYIAESKTNDKSYIYLHIVPSDPELVENYNAELGFVNSDFLFGAKKIKQQVFRSKVAKIELPDYAIGKIETGQLENKQILWQAEIDLSAQFFLPDDYSITTATLTDNNWSNGVHIDGTVLLLSGNSRANLSLVGKKIITPDGITVAVTNVFFPSSEWTHVMLESPIAIPSDKPYTFKIMN